MADKPALVRGPALERSSTRPAAFLASRKTRIAVTNTARTMAGELPYQHAVVSPCSSLIVGYANGR